MANLLSLFISALLFASAASAEEVYQTSEDFVSSAFSGEVPTPALLWISGPLRDEASAILGHPPDTLRTRYWRKDQRTVWILEEIGKESPITMGLIVQDHRLEKIKILIYRETRGWEVRHDFFTRQFQGARLSGKNALDRPIDGIAGATLSANAMRKVARLALLYHRHVTANVAP